MDVETKEAARRKAHGITEHIGYPSELTDKTKLEELYRGLELNSTHFLGNALNMTVFGTNYAFSKLREKASCNLHTQHTNPIIAPEKHLLRLLVSRVCCLLGLPLRRGCLK